jgi:hypothetical protein
VLLNFLKNYTDTKIDENFGNVGSVAYALRSGEKLVWMDYELMEDPEVKKLQDKADRQRRAITCLYATCFGS